MCLIILALVIGAIILAKQGKLGPPPWARHGGPGWGPGGPKGPGGPGHHGPGHHCPDHQGPGPHGPEHHGPAPEERAYGILAERLASGDITPEEYRERVTVLRETAATQFGPGGPGPQGEPNPHDPHPGDLR